jgi:hypothetical protein
VLVRCYRQNLGPKRLVRRAGSPVNGSRRSASNLSRLPRHSAPSTRALAFIRSTASRAARTHDFRSVPSSTMPLSTSPSCSRIPRLHLSREKVFDLWAGPSSPWSVWSKPIVFSYLPAMISASDDQPLPSPMTAPWLPDADGSTVLVVELPGVQSVRIGETLAHAGFRPIPLFNAVPASRSGAREDDDQENHDHARTVVDVYPIIEAIEQATPRLRDRLERMPAEAPPAFLLDADRRLGRAPRAGDFDNRSVSLPTDFPSAAFLQSRGVTRALVLVAAHNQLAIGGQPATDLAHTLLRWQAAGIPILSCTLAAENLEGSSSRRITVSRPSWFGAIWYNALCMIGLRPNPMGGFGGTLPVPSAG